MCLVPFFHRAYSTNAGGMKFLQVVRDGRDIAFSGNQSPVTKFYKANFDPQQVGREPAELGLYVYVGGLITTTTTPSTRRQHSPRTPGATFTH